MIAAAAAAAVAWSDEAVGMLGAVVVIVPAAATGDSGRGNGADGDAISSVGDTDDGVGYTRQR